MEAPSIAFGLLAVLAVSLVPALPGSSGEVYPLAADAVGIQTVHAPRIGPGSQLLVSENGRPFALCTAGFVFGDGQKLYLSTAGHCLLPPGAASTHGADADFDAGRITASADGHALGPLAYARRENSSEPEDVGNDFGIMEILPGSHSHVEVTVPVWGGPVQIEPVNPGRTTALCFYGHGQVVGDHPTTKARFGIRGNLHNPDFGFWGGHLPANNGDSGAPVVSCAMAEEKLEGVAAVGILTHGGVHTGVASTGLGLTGTRGTTIEKAQEMAREAGLEIELVIDAP